MASRYYFDWAATALPDPITERPASFGNPSSRHREGVQAREILEDARTRCAALLGVSRNNIYFTSGGTESNALIVHSLLFRKTGELLVSRGEHPSILENSEKLSRLGKKVIPIGLESQGAVSPRLLEHALKKGSQPRMAAIMGVNNETGAVNDLGALGETLRRRSAEKGRILFHSDLVQMAGKLPLDIAGWDLDSASLSAHKLGGPRGIGLLFLKSPLETIYAGGGQERGIRPGTENVAGAAAFADVLERRIGAIGENYDQAADRLEALIGGLKKTGRCVLIPEDRSARDPQFSPYILQAAFEGVPGEVMVRALDDAGFALSTGSACSSGKQERPILQAMGIDEKTSLEGIRISQGWTTNMEAINALIEAIGGILRAI